MALELEHLKQLKSTLPELSYSRELVSGKAFELWAFVYFDHYPQSSFMLFIFLVIRFDWRLPFYLFLIFIWVREKKLTLLSLQFQAIFRLFMAFLPYFIQTKGYRYFRLPVSNQRCLSLPKLFRSNCLHCRLLETHQVSIH
jgi:hypothetical protein